MATKTELALQTSQALSAELQDKLAAAKMRSRQLSKKIEEVRADPYLNAGIGVAAAGIGGGAAAILDEALPPLAEFGGDASGNGKVQIKAGLLGGLGVVALGVSEESSTLMDLGKGMVAYEVGTQVAAMVKGMFK